MSGQGVPSAFVGEALEYLIHASSAIAKDLIAQHNLTEDEYDEYKEIVEILGRELSCIGMDS